MKSAFQSIIIFLLVGIQPLAASQSSASPDMPKGLWQAFSEARHMVEENKGQGDGYAYRAYNPNNGYGIRYGEQGLTLKKGEWVLSMALEAYGQGENLKPVKEPSLNTEGNKVTFDRGNVSEWYINGPKGLEQGFTLRKPAGFNPDEHLVLSMDLSGNLSPKWKTNGQSIAFYKDDTKAFDYDKLKAFDANGKTLAATLAFNEKSLQILVDAKDATWPVIVDPIFASEQKVISSMPDAAAGDEFGYSVAMDGDTAIIGAPYDDDNGTDVGSTYVFVYIGNDWISQGKLQPSVVTDVQKFGASVAVSGDTVVVGAPLSDIDYINKGVAYVFTRSSAIWSQAAILSSSHTAANINLGTSVAVSGDSAVVGGPGLNVVYFYEKGVSWSNMSETVYFTNGESGSNYGKSVAMSGSRALAGAPNAANGGSHRGYVQAYEHDGSDWLPVGAVLSASDAADYDLFGTSIALDGDSALIGAPGTGNSGNAAYLFFDSVGGWVETQILTATGGSATGDYFGCAVALDLPLAIIGAWGDDDNGADSGSAYVFESNFGLNQVAKLTASDGASEDYFGEAVAVSGETILVGVRGDDDGGSYSGSVYTFEKPLAGWADGNETAKLVAVTAPVAGAAFGYSVAIDNDTALIGAVNDYFGTVDSGAAYVFTQADSSWSMQAKLVPITPNYEDKFGHAVALDGDTALIGAMWDDDNGLSSGTAYVYTRSGSNWSPQTKLVAPDGAAGDHFGVSVALEGDTAVIGAQHNGDIGAAYVFYRIDSMWGNTYSKLTDPDPVADALFGASVDISGDSIIVGAPATKNDGTNPAGRAIVFVKVGSAWSVEATFGKYLNSNTRWGEAVAIDGDTVLVGAPQWSYNEPGDGLVIVYTRSGTQWSLQQDLVAPDGANSDYFGTKLDLKGNTAVVGVYSDDDAGTNSGSAYVFARSDTTWNFLKKLTASDAALDDFYGVSVSISGDTVLVGASGDDAFTGSAYFNRFECGFAGPVVANRWTMFGLPCAPDTDADTVGELFGDTLDVNDYYYRWIVYSRNHTTDMYKRLNPGDTVEQGVGYWLLSLDDNYWDATGSLTEYPVTFAQDCSDPAGCFEIPLTPPDSVDTDRYNLVGYPGNKTINWAGARFLIDGNVFTPEQAEQLGYASKNIWKYNGNGYDVYDTSTPGMVGELNSHEGIWVRMLGNSSGLGTAYLLIPANSILSEPPGPPMTMLEQDTVSDSNGWLARIVDFFIPSAHAGKPTWEQEWYLRLIAEAPAENLKDRGNVLGQLQDSVAGYDSHDLIELDPFSTPYLTLVFPHDDWGTESGNYASDYHEAVDYYAEDQWVFQVKSDNPYRDINLYWDGIYLLEGIWSQDTGKRTFSKSKQADGGALLQRMWLEDMDTGERVEAIIEDPITGAFSKQSHQFNMNGLTVRTFRWVLDSDGGKSPKKPKKPKSNSSGKVKVKNTPPGLDRIDMQPPEAGQN